MDQIGEVIDSFGGSAAFAKATGLKDSHVRTMRTRKSLPLEHWPVIIAAAAASGIPGITYESLALMHSKGATTTPSPSDSVEAVRS